jgi:hypothetical protein
MNIVTGGVPGTLAGLLLLGLTPSDGTGGSPGTPTGPMRQVILRRTPGPSPIGNISLDARAAVTFGFNGFNDVVIPCDGTFKNFSLTLTASPGIGASRTITLVVNNVDTALTLSMSDGTLSGTLTSDVAVSVGDRVRLAATVTGAPASADFLWSLEFEPDAGETSFYGTNVGTAQFGFVDLFTGEWSGTASNCKRLIPCAGTITSLVALNTFDSVTAPNALNLYLYKNGVKQDGSGGTVNTLLSHTDAAINTEVVASFSLPVVRGDEVYLGIEEAGTYPASWLAMSMTFEADVAGEHILATRVGGTPSQTVTNYGPVMGQAAGVFSWTSIADNVALECGVSSIHLGDLLLEAENDPGAGNTRSFALLRAGAAPTDGPAGDVTTGSLVIDDTRYASFSTGQAVGPMQHVPDSLPTVSGRVWSSLVITLGAPDPEEPPTEPTPGGAAPEGEEPAESELPLGITRIMVVLTYGSGSPQSKIKLTETPFFIDPPSWHGGYGHPWLISVGELGRELADTLRGTDVTVRVGDPEQFFRTLAATETLAGATMEIFLVSDTVRYALGEPHRRFAGAVHGVRALPDMQFEFTIRDVQSEEMGRLADFPLLPPAKITPEVFPGATKDYQNRAIPIALGEVSDETETTPQGVVPPLIVAPSMNLTTFGGINVQVVGTILSHGALPPNGLWQGYYNPVDNPYVRIPIPASAEGTILTWPGAAGWNYVGVDPDLFIDFPLSDPTKTHRYTPVFFLASDPNVQAFLDGRIQIAFNVYGLTDEPDGSGLYFADAPDIYEFLIRNYLYQPHWRYGPYNEMPTFAGGYSFIDHASVVRARERLRSFSGTSPGRYPVGRLLGANGQQESLKAVLNSLCVDVLMEQGRDRHGRILLDVEDVNAVATHELSDLLDIEDGEFEVWIDRSAYYNHCEYYFGERYLPAVAPLPAPPEGETLPPVNLGAHDKWQSIGTYTHDDAVAANRGRQTPALQLENRWVRDSDVAVSVVERTIARAVGPGPMRDGQRLFRLRTSWQALSVELGDVIAIDHIEGFGAAGFVGQRARVLKISEDLQNARITLEGRVLYSEGSPS